MTFDPISMGIVESHGLERLVSAVFLTELKRRLRRECLSFLVDDPRLFRENLSRLDMQKLNFYHPLILDLH